MHVHLFVLIYRNKNFDQHKSADKKLNVIHQRKPTKSIFESSLLISDSSEAETNKQDSTNPSASKDEI